MESDVTVLHSGSTGKSADNWSKAFSAKKKSTKAAGKSKATAKKKTTKKKAAKKKSG